ncbi:hypothetical protein [Dactylosporangium cerinum]
MSYSMPTPPPMVMSFGVRAVDAAGNRSPSRSSASAPHRTPRHPARRPA